MPGETRIELLRMAVGRIADRAPATALTVVARLVDDPLRRMPLFAVVLRQWTKADPLAAWRHAAAVEDVGQRRAFAAEVAGQWTDFDPGAAMTSLAGNEWAKGLRRDLLGDWARDEWWAALAWASSLPASASRDAMRAVVFATMAVHASYETLQTIEELDDEKRSAIYDSPAYRETLREHLARMDAAEVVSWFERQPDPEVRRRIAAEVARRNAESGVAQALEWAQHVPDVAERPGAVWAVIESAVGSRLRVRETADNELLERAGRFAERILDSALAGSAYAALLSVWASNDLRAAVDYLEGIAGERERDIATLGLLSGMLHSAPDFGGSDADNRATTDIGQDQRWRVAEMERLYLSLPVAIRPAPIARWLYGYHRKADPQRAESYQAKGSADTRD